VRPLLPLQLQRRLQQQLVACLTQIWLTLQLLMVTMRQQGVCVCRLRLRLCC
jgi:hypothetical protein